MILVDFSSITHRKIYTAITKSKPSKTNGQYNTHEFITLAKFLIFQELFDIKREFEKKFGDMIICVDNKSPEGYWRRDVDRDYKATRSKIREVSEINFGEVFLEISVLTEQLMSNIPWKVIDVHRAEADDSMLILSREFSPFEKILIHSPDKDMIQAQRDTDSVHQYSPITGKWLVPENKHGDMSEWILEHVCLGDISDNVPKIIDRTEFSPTFLEYLESNGIEENTPVEFKDGISREKKIELITNFDVFKLNRKGESTGVKDVYLTPNFGPAALKKQIEKHGSLDAWLDSHPQYRGNYERNFTLVMEEGIPDNIRDSILLSHKNAKTDYNLKEFESYLSENGLKSIIMDLPSIFKLNRELTADDFDW